MKQLQLIRKIRGYKSARAFAEANGFSVSTYTAYEQGQHEPDLKTLCLLADILDCTTDQILGRVPISVHL